jgi:hypothetical protein
VVDREATEDQKRAIEYSGKHLLINAGPGLILAHV